MKKISNIDEIIKSDNYNIAKQPNIPEMLQGISEEFFDVCVQRAFDSHSRIGHKSGAH